jgi:hypothetical protein
MIRSASYREFSPLYLREHARHGNRRLHYAGTGIGLVALGYSRATQTWLALLILPLAGYGYAWVGHFAVERNRPATFVHPLWSLTSDQRMFFLWMFGRLGAEFDSAGVRR